MKSMRTIGLIALMTLCACAQATNSSTSSLASQIVGNWTYANGSNWETLGFDSNKTYHESASVNGTSYSLTGVYSITEPDKISVNATYSGQSLSYSYFDAKVSGNQLKLSQSSGSATVTVTLTRQ